MDPVTEADDLFAYKSVYCFPRNSRVKDSPVVGAITVLPAAGHNRLNYHFSDSTRATTEMDKLMVQLGWHKLFDLLSLQLG